MAKSDATRSVLRGFGTRGTKRHDNRRLWNNKSHILMQFGVPVMQALLGEDLRSLSRKETKLLKQRFRGRFQPTDDVVLETLREIGDSGFGSSETIAPVLPKAQGCQMETVNGNAILEATKTNVSSDEILPDIVGEDPYRPSPHIHIATTTLPRTELSGCEKGLACSGQKATVSSVNTFQSKENVPDNGPAESSEELPDIRDPVPRCQLPSLLLTNDILSELHEAIQPLNECVKALLPKQDQHRSNCDNEDLKQEIRHLTKRGNEELKKEIQHLIDCAKEEIEKNYRQLGNEFKELRAMIQGNAGGVWRATPKHDARDSIAAATWLVSLAGDR
mmetsp:Transcript_122473/g.342798  ORF Transcript_122473/g.342798 Transcript_122473/m.342798 type:complete len:333 (-) Transcript_122473:152-1150(-)